MKNQTRRTILTTAVVCVGLLTLGATRASAGPCSEITQAIAWNQQSIPQEYYPVRAYLSKHYGFDAAGANSLRDTVHYAVGEVSVSYAPTLHLTGTLYSVFANNTAFGMDAKPTLSYAVKIFPDGAITYTMQVNGQGPPPVTVRATCVDNKLLTVIAGSQVLTIGVAMQPYVDAGW